MCHSSFIYDTDAFDTKSVLQTCCVKNALMRDWLIFLSCFNRWQCYGVVLAFGGLII